MRREKVLGFALVVSALLVLSAVGCAESSGPQVTCTAADGTWNVHFTLMDGTNMGGQTWAISQTGCDIAATAQPAADGSIGISPEGASGYAFDVGLRAFWSSTVGPCTTDSNLEATVSAGTMTGTVYWCTVPNGAGYCSAGGGTGECGTYLMTATRP